MKIDIQPVDWEDDEFKTLVATSHQHSLYVLPEWLEFSKPTTLGAYTREGLSAVVFAHTRYTSFPFIQWQGILQSRREQLIEIDALLEVLEDQVKKETEPDGGPPLLVASAPAMVDVVPFYWRPKPWVVEVRYTYRLTAQSRPSYSISPGPPPVECAPDREDFSDISWTEEGWEQLGQITRFDSVMQYAGDGMILVGSDLQKRGYLIAATGRNWQGLTLQVAKRYDDFDLGGANSREMRRKKRPLGGLLRTGYLARW